MFSCIETLTQLSFYLPASSKVLGFSLSLNVASYISLELPIGGFLRAENVSYTISPLSCSHLKKNHRSLCENKSAKMRMDDAKMHVHAKI
jgi:hypothetical protein